MKIQRTPQFDEALRLMETGGAFTFVTGRAGTGKSTLLKYFRETTKLLAPVLAPTGVAALNVDGETIHRFFRFAPGITVKDARRKASVAFNKETYLQADALVIDEISMVRADLMDCMDQFLRVIRKNKTPFGGLRIIAIGDLYQLPPVVSSLERAAFAQLYDSPYFFASHAVKELLQAGAVSFMELEKVYRQSDPSFIALLNAVRNRSLSEADLKKLNARVHATPAKDVIVLTAVNDAADALNEQRLQALSGSSKMFSGSFRGEFPEREAPADTELFLKKGARVMCVANDVDGRYVNGSLGRVRAFTQAGGKNETESAVIITLDDGGEVVVTAHTWTVYRSTYDQATRSLGQEKLGSFTQIPLKLAWAVTIHKSQGKTFDQAVIDLGRGAFAAGQTYVALSRCRSFDGLALARPVRSQDIKLDYSIVKFVTSLQYDLSCRSMPLEEKIACLKQAAKQGRRIRITYLKGKDEKSVRTVVPACVEEGEYAGHAFLALRAWCELRQEERTFNVERILEIQEL